MSGALWKKYPAVKSPHPAQMVMVYDKAATILNRAIAKFKKYENYLVWSPYIPPYPVIHCTGHSRILHKALAKALNCLDFLVVRGSKPHMADYYPESRQSMKNFAVAFNKVQSLIKRNSFPTVSLAIDSEE